MDNDMVTISSNEYRDLLEDQRWRQCFQNAGVDNWEGYDYAMEDFCDDDS